LQVRIIDGRGLEAVGAAAAAAGANG